MLGWSICIEQSNVPETTLFATWETGVGGTRWITTQLCQQNKAREIKNTGGYPNVYETQVQYIRPWLLAGQTPSANAADTLALVRRDDGDIQLQPGDVPRPPASDAVVFMTSEDGQSIEVSTCGYAPLQLRHMDQLRNLPPEATLFITVFDLS